MYVKLGTKVILFFFTVNVMLTDSVKTYNIIEKKNHKNSDKFEKNSKMYVNSNLLIGDNKVEKSSIFTKYAPKKRESSR